MVGHQRRGAALERVEGEPRQLRGAEGRVGRHADRAAEGEHLVVDERQLIEHAGQRRAHGTVGVDDRAGLVAAVDAEVELELGGGRIVAVDGPALEVDDHDLLGRQLGKHGARGRDRHERLGARRDVAGGAQHEALVGQAPRGGGDAVTLRVKHVSV